MRFVNDLVGLREGEIHEIRLSNRLAVLYALGVVFLVAVVLASVLWVSREHNQLAKRASERLVSAAIAGHKSKVETLVRDYSIWDRAYAALRSEDRAWLWRNLGTAATEIGTLDLIVFVDPIRRIDYGWADGVDDLGQSGLLPPALLDKLVKRANDPFTPKGLLTRYKGGVWAFAAAPVTPVEGPPPDVPPEDLPIQIHGLELTQERLDAFSQSLLLDGPLKFAETHAPDEAYLELYGADGTKIAGLVWPAPRPGQRILSRLAMPLTVALAIAAAVGFLSAWLAVRSARRLELALDAAREADRLKSEFLSNVTHELRTPMNGILGVAQLLEMSRLDDEQRELLDILFASARAQMALIGDLLDFSQLETGDRRLSKQPFAPARALDEVAGLVRALIARKGLAFSADWSALEGLVVEGDARAFRQVVTNLLGNAAKFTETGSIDAVATVELRDDEAEIVVTIKDTGVGIPPEKLERIFERFYRVDGSLARATEGAGLGLAISQRLATLMGGRIEVESAEGEGSVFRFRVALTLGEDVASARRAA